MIEKIEADDIISYICRYSQYKDEQKVIVSSDKDFFQLLDDKTVLYRPVQKVILNRRKVIEEYASGGTEWRNAGSIVVCQINNENVKVFKATQEQM